MKVIFKNTNLEFQSFKAEVFDYKFQGTCDSGLSNVSSKDVVAGNKYAAIIRVYSDTNNIQNVTPYIYEKSGSPILLRSTKKGTTSEGYVDFYTGVGVAANTGRVGLSCTTGHTIVYDCILFDVTANPAIENNLANISFDRVKNSIN